MSQTAGPKTRPFNGVRETRNDQTLFRIAVGLDARRLASAGRRVRVPGRCQGPRQCAAEQELVTGSGRNRSPTSANISRRWRPDRTVQGFGRGDHSDLRLQDRWQQTRCIMRYRDMELLAKHLGAVLAEPDKAKRCFDPQKDYDAFTLYTRVPRCRNSRRCRAGSGARSSPTTIARWVGRSAGPAWSSTRTSSR